MTLHLLTATGMRPQAWAICERLMARQDYAGPVTWVIVDDGAEAQPVTFSREGWALKIIRPEPRWQPGQNTQARNLLAGLDVIPADSRVVLLEDDDYYSPRWLTTVDRHLDHAELVGESPTKYYNVPQKRGRIMNNNNRASLCSTAVRGHAIESLRWACEHKTYIDMKLWARHRSQYVFPGNDVVGIKGLPGRAGIGIGHKEDFRGQDDPSGALLRSWIGDDAKLYGV